MKKENILKCLRVCWGGFNHWRKKHWPFRVIVFLLMSSPVIATYLEYGDEGPLRFYTRLACRQIEIRKTAPVTLAWTRYFYTFENKRLQNELSNSSNKLRLSEQEKKQLRLKPSKANLKILFLAAKNNNIMPHSANFNRLSRQNRAAATYETKRRFQHEYASVYRMIDKRQYYDYSSVETWQLGADYFIWYLTLFFVMPPTGTALTWMFLCAGCGIIFSWYIPRWKKTAGVCFAVCITLILLICNHYSTSQDSSFYRLMMSLVGGYTNIKLFYGPTLFYQLFYGAAMSLFGSWMAEKYMTGINKRARFICSLAFAGVILIATSQYITKKMDGAFSLYGELNGFLITNCDNMTWLPNVLLFLGCVVVGLSILSIFLKKRVC